MQQKNTIIFSPLLLGIISLILQVLFLRFYLDIFLGNELMIGTVFSVWLIGTAMGSLFFDRLHLLRYSPIFLFATIFLFMFSYLLINLAPLLFHLIPGTFPDFRQSLFILLISLLPTAFCVGTLFPFIIQVVKNTDGEPISQLVIRAYRYESLGAFWGAFILNLIFFNWLSGFQILMIVLAGTLIIGWILFPHHRNIHTISFIFILIFLVLLSQGNRLQKQLFHYAHPQFQLTAQKDTPYGNLKFATYQEQSLIFLGGTILTTRPNPMENEFRTLLPVLVAQNPGKILWLGGDLFAAMEYFSKIPEIKQIDYVHIDPLLVEEQRDSIQTKWNSQQLPQIRFHIEDIRAFLSRSSTRYDIICLNLPEPHTLYFSRYYSLQFYRLIRERLSHGGIFYFAIHSSENYINPPLARYIQDLITTLSRVFPEYFILPGDMNYIFASPERPLQNIPQLLQQRLQQRKWPARYLNSAYVQYQYSPERIQWFQSQLQTHPAASLNTDANLRAYLDHFLVWGTLHAPGISALLTFTQKHSRVLSIFLVGILLLIQLVFWRWKRYWHLNKLFFLGAFSIVQEILLLLEFEILFGNLYYQVAFVIGGFMLGLVAGTLVAQKKLVPSSRTIRMLFVGNILLLLALAFPLNLNVTSYQNLLVQQILSWAYLPLLIFLMGGVMGAGFQLITEWHFRKGKVFSTGITYGIDISGAVLGAFLFSVIIIPVLGLKGTILLTIVIMLVLLL